MVHESDFSSDLLLEAEVGGFLVPEGEGGRYGVHRLNAMHDPSGESCGEVGDQSGSVFCFIILGADDIQLERVDVFLELFSGVDASGGQPIHGFSSGIGINKGGLKVLLELGECSE